MSSLPLVFDAPRRGTPPRHLADVDPADRAAVAQELGVLRHLVLRPVGAAEPLHRVLERAAHQHVELVEAQPVDAGPLSRHRHPEGAREGPRLAGRHGVHEGAQPLRQVGLHLRLVRVPHAVEERLPDLAQVQVVDVARALQVALERLDGLVARLDVCEGGVRGVRGV